MNDSNKLDAFKSYALSLKSDGPDIQEIWLFTSNTKHPYLDEHLYGFIVVDPVSEDLDNHCEQCAEEFTPIAFKAHDELKYPYLMLCIGETKMNRLKSKRLVFSQINIIERLI